MSRFYAINLVLGLHSKKETLEGTIGTVVPNHKELKIGTLKGIIELAKIEVEDFEKYL